MRNYRRTVGVLVALGMFVAALAVQAKEPDCPTVGSAADPNRREVRYRSYSWIDYGKCVRLRSNASPGVLTDGWFTRFQTTCPVKVGYPFPIPNADLYKAPYYTHEPCYLAAEALNNNDEASITRDDGVFYLTLIRPAQDGKPAITIIDHKPLLSVKIKFEDEETRTVAYRTDRPVEVEVKTQDGTYENRLFDYYIYLAYAESDKKQIKYYNIEAFDVGADARCQDERPNASNTELSDCDSLPKGDFYRSGSYAIDDRATRQNRSGGGGEPMPNQ